VSLLERLGRGHLDDASFARLWAAPVGDAADTVPAHPHLATCAACRQRFAEFGGWVDAVAAELRDEADEVFSPDRLAQQQSQIARRLEALDRPARVIAFPKAARAVINGHSHVRRWVTVAAAASLIAGFGLGQVMPLRKELSRQQAVDVAPLTQAKSEQIAKEIAPSTAPINDELFSDTFARSHVPSLSALDDMTPHVRDAAPGSGK
jgi:hypothetical protein